MLLVNVDDVLRLTNSDITHRDSKIKDDNKFIFFDTDKFMLGLSTLPKNSFITPDTLLDVFTNSFTEGYIDYSMD